MGNVDRWSTPGCSRVHNERKDGMKWFIEVFIPSLESRMKNGACDCWITEKQVAVCRKYMKPKEYYPGYYIKVGQWQYSVTVFKKGYGRFTRTDRRSAYI